MRVIMESLFDIAYLVCVIILGISMLRKSKDTVTRLFGWMSLVLVFGDAFHLVPRIIGLNSPLGLDGFTASLGIGKLVTSITMTVFYVMLYYFWKENFQMQPGKGMDWIILILAAVRIVLCLFPQNEWTHADAPVSWGIWRNIPFVVLGAIIVVLLWRTRAKSRFFRWAWLAVTLSFLFYIPVVLWADVSPMIGMLMLPKTCCYVWLVVMGWKFVSATQKAEI